MDIIKHIVHVSGAYLLYTIQIFVFKFPIQISVKQLNICLGHTLNRELLTLIHILLLVNLVKHMQYSVYTDLVYFSCIHTWLTWSHVTAHKTACCRVLHGKVYMHIHAYDSRKIITSNAMYNDWISQQSTHMISRHHRQFSSTFKIHTCLTYYHVCTSIKITVYVCIWKWK